MIGVIAEHIKTHRHQLGKHALFVGSGVKIPPEDRVVGTAIGQMALRWAGERVAGEEGEERVRAALELLAAQVPDHAERCRMLREELGDQVRPAEGHVRLSRLIKDGYYSHIFLAEPDNLLERALRAQHMEPQKDYHLLVAGVDEPDEIKVAIAESSRLAIMKCGGDLERDFLPLTPAEIGAVADGLHDVLAESLKLYSVFVGFQERDDPFLTHVPREGARIFWINPTIPTADEDLYHELKLESPASAEWHAFQPHVISLLDARHSTRHLLCREPGGFNEFFAKLHARLIRRRHGARGKKRELTVLRGGPYRFLDHFDLEDVDFYFGREDDTRQVMERIGQNALTVVMGKSGVGKTSLLRAGVMAALRKEIEEGDAEQARPWLVAYCRVGEDPTLSIRAAVLAAAREAGFDPSEAEAEEKLRDMVRQVAALTRRQVVVLLDQFAEYFVRLGDKVRERFCESLCETLTEAEGDFRLVITIREDYVGALWDLQEHFPTIYHNLHRVKRLTREQAEDAVLKPAQNFELQVERSLVQRIVTDLNRDGVEPSQLQIVCHALYEGRSRGSWVLTERLYDQLGGATEILEKYLERALGQLPPGEKQLATRVLTFMAGTSELVAPQPLDRIVTESGGEREEVERNLAHLVDVGLLRPVGRGRRREWELMHEVLADRIQRDLAGRELAARNVQDLLTRAMNDHNQFGLYMGVEDLRLVSAAGDDLTMSPEELRLVIHSALAAEHEADLWFGRAGELEEAKGEFLAELVDDPAPQVRLTTYQKLASHLEPRLIRHLVRGLDDELPEVRTLAAGYLGQLERHLLAMLENPHPRVRSLAARALGYSSNRRVVRRLVDAYLPEDIVLRDEITEALARIDDPKAADMLLKLVSGNGEGNWAAANALGQLSVGEDDLKALQRQVNGRGRAELWYALGVAQMGRRSFDEAAEALTRALELAADQRGRNAVRDAEAELAAQAERTAADDDTWGMYGRTAGHVAASSQVVTPPLELSWEFETKDHVVAPPVVRDNTAYIGSRDRKFYAVDTGKGTARWSFDAPERIEAGAALHEDLVILATLGGTVHALRVASGEQRWRTNLGTPVRAGCVVEGEALYVATRGGEALRLEVHSGKVVWRAQAPAEIAATPAVWGETVVVGVWDGHLIGLSTVTGHEKWRHKTGGPVSASPSTADGLIYCGSDDHRLTALRAESGEVVWATRLGGQLRGGSALSESLVVTGAMDGKCYCLSREDGAVVWTASTSEDILATPAIAGDVVYVGSKDGALYAFDLATGDELWRHQTAFGVYSSPAIAEQSVFVGLNYYRLAAFRPTERAPRKR